MKTTKLFSKGNQPLLHDYLRFAAITVALLLPVLGLSQTPQKIAIEEWATTGGTQNSFQRSIVRSKTISGIVYYYTAGATINSSGNYDMLITKQNSSGNVLWTNTYAGSGNGDDFATDVQIDNVGNVYITGTYYKNATDSNNAITIKYNNAGTQKWVATYNGAGSQHDANTALMVSGNTIISVGVSWQGNTNKYDMLLIRYDSLGTQQWANTWDYASLNDVAINLYLNMGSLFVAGGAQAGTLTYKYAVLKINTANGSVTSSTVTGGSALGFDQLTDIQQDNFGNIYVTGAVMNMGTGYDYKTVKYDSTLTQLWAVTYTGAGSLDDVATGLYIDSVNNVIVTGYTNTATQGKNFATVKYNPAGVQQWVKTFNGAANKSDSASAIVTKGTDIYVTGSSYNGTSRDYYTIKYDGSGNEIWAVSWNSPSNKNDIPTAIAVDDKGAVLVTGQTKIAGANTYNTIKYSTVGLITPNDNEQLNKAFCFTENRGQLLNTAMNQTDVKYYNRTGGNPQQVYFRDENMSYVFARLDTAQTNPIDSLHRIDMTFLNGRSSKVYAKDQRSDYENFFLAHIPDGCLRMKTYNQVFRTEIYTKIDVVYSSNAAGMKYFFIVKPGGNPADIQQDYSGANSIYLNGDDLVVSSDLGVIYHKQPQAWEIDAAGNTYPLNWQPSYNINGNTVTFTLNGNYNTSNTLVIGEYNDVVNGMSNQITGTNLDWSTHYGSLAGGETPFNAVKTDKAGNSYWGGTTSGNNFPVSPGAFQSVGGLGGDWTLIKINSVAVRQWATYYGGTAAETFATFVLDSSANIYFCGTTQSSILSNATNQPSGAYIDASHNGGNDLFFFKIDSSGQNLAWSTYYGSAAFERPQAMYIEPSGENLTVVGVGNSTFPLVNLAGAYNSTSGSSFILQFDSQLAVKWSTLFGNNSSIQDVDGDGSGTLFMVGSTQPNGSVPYVNPGGGAYFDNTNSAWDAFIVRFNQADTITWCTAFGGSSSDNGYAIVVSGKDFYVSGSTTSNFLSFPLQAAAGEYIDVNVNSNNPDGWMARFAVTGIKKWCTYWGGMGLELVLDLACDDNGYLYAFGTTDSPTNSLDLYATGNSYSQANPFFSSEAFIVAFNPQNQRTWATCFGGNRYESGSVITTYGNSMIYIAGYSYSLPTTYPWAYPNQVPNEWIDTLKTNVNQYTGYMARFDITAISVGFTDEEVYSNTLFSIYPNPTAGVFTLQVNEVKGEDVCIKIYDILGQEVFNRNFANYYGTLQEQIDLSILNNGVYMVTVQVGNRFVKTERIIKQQ